MTCAAHLVVLLLQITSRRRSLHFQHIKARGLLVELVEEGTEARAKCLVVVPRLDGHNGLHRAGVGWATAPLHPAAPPQATQKTQNL